MSDMNDAIKGIAPLLIDKALQEIAEALSPDDGSPKKQKPASVNKDLKDMSIGEIGSMIGAVMNAEEGATKGPGMQYIDDYVARNRFENFLKYANRFGIRTNNSDDRCIRIIRDAMKNERRIIQDFICEIRKDELDHIYIQFDLGPQIHIEYSTTYEVMLSGATLDNIENELSREFNIPAKLEHIDIELWNKLGPDIYEL